MVNEQTDSYVAGGIQVLTLFTLQLGFQNARLLDLYSQASYNHINE